MIPRSCQPRYCYVCVLIVVSIISVHFGPKGTIFNNYYKLQKSKDLPEKYISAIINKHNSEFTIQNADIYSHLQENTVIFVVLVDKFAKQLKSLLASLSRVEGIGDALLIFSHSYYDENINKVIKGIEFCRVVQMFYPYSVQTYSTAFPGRHPHDCPTHTNKKIAVASGCRGASHPDFRGHYRNPILTERKHSWWWTANTVFEILNCTTNSGLVIFLEDDFYLLKDIIYMALYMKKSAESLAQCEFFSMGTDSVPDLRDDRMYAAELSVWDPKLHSSVLAFDLNTWNIIASHYDLYCSVDDSSWLRSLYFISINRKNGIKFKVMSSVVPRAFKIGDSHFSFDMLGVKGDTDLKSYESSKDSEWFPPFIELYINIEAEESDVDKFFDYRDSDGSWADPRDKKLCIQMSKRKIKKVLMDMINEYNTDGKQIR